MSDAIEFSSPCDDCPEQEENCKPEEMVGCFQLAWQKLRAARAESQAENMCDACAGTGEPVSGKPCMCGGSGKMSDAAIYLREQLAKEQAQVERKTEQADKFHEMYLQVAAKSTHHKDRHRQISVALAKSQAELERLREVIVDNDECYTVVENRAEDAEKQLNAVREAAFIEDCHITGTHNPEHTPKFVCAEQLRGLAKRVTAILFGIEWGRDMPASELNKLPRKINRKGWYRYYQENEQYHPKAVELEKWEANGYAPLKRDED